MFLEFIIKIDKKKLMFSEISNTSWLEKENVVRDFKNNLNRGR